MNAPESQSLRGAKVLVVDDDCDNREMLVAVLEHSGAMVSAAGSSAEALSVLEKERPHVLITDIGLPDEDGFGLLKRIRALPSSRGGDIPSIALTGYGSDADRAMSREMGFQAHLTKPVAFEEMVATVARLLRSSTRA
jgi:CheY-like chemotaxis protein